ncbi:MAG: competence/damage-inducible protein A [bacterium]|nr:competence/damage-inducible protein A [bacterium]
MNAEIIAVGSELLTPTKVDTNSLYLTDQLNGLGIEVVAKSVIGDDRDRLSASVKAAAARSNIVLLTGGLGPTEDDVTREAVARALGREMDFRQDIADAIEERFRKFGRKMSEINRRQAYVIAGAEPLPNDRGTAPGQWLPLDSGGAIALLPGPPRELKAMFTKQCQERLERLVPLMVIRTLQFRVSGMPESDLDQLISPVYTEYANPVTTILASPGDIQIHLRARCTSAEEADGLLAEVGPRIEELLGDRIYSRNGDSLEETVGKMLRTKGATVAVAESCTGGALAARLTSIAGSSDYFVGGFLTYTNAMKQELLGVDAGLLAAYTAVSQQAAEAMATAAREKTGATYALSVTGYAGPGGGTEENPVGTVFIGLADPTGCAARRYRLSIGERERVRRLATQTALDMLRRKML